MVVSLPVSGARQRVKGSERPCGDTSQPALAGGTPVRKDGSMPAAEDTTRKLGHVLVLVAMGSYAVAVLSLNFYGVQTAPTELDLTYFDLLTGQGAASDLGVAGALMMTFGAPLLITILDLMLLTGRRLMAARHGVVAAITTWAVITLGSALNILGLDVFPVGVGFWAQLVCVGVAIAGALLLMTDPVEDDAALT